MSSLKEKLSQFNADLPLERAKTIPSFWYTDPEIYELERKAIFHRSWQFVGRGEQFAETGNFVTEVIAGEPVLAVKDREGMLRAFSNVCRHRAASVAAAPCGQALEFQCRYHGWTYDLTGRLKHAPDFEGVADFYREEQTLPPWKVSSAGPFVFVHGNPSPVSLKEYLFPFPERAASSRMEAMRFVGRKEYVVQCNWKVLVEHQLSGGSDRTEIARNTSLRTSSADGANYWWIFPNLMVNLYDGMMDAKVVRPLGHDRCRLKVDSYFEHTEGPVDYERIAERLRTLDGCITAANAVCEEVNANLSTRSFDTGRYSVRRESGVHHFHQLLARELLEWSA